MQWRLPLKTPMSTDVKRYSSVLADGRDDKNQKLGKAGGFIGEMSGTNHQNSDANLFNYIIDARQPEVMPVS